MRAADALVDILKTEGVKFVSTLPGDDILPIFDALHENGQVPLILTRHEQATVYIADGYARSTGEVGVAMVTKGPGRCNAFTAIVNAFTDCVPLVVIFGHSSRNQLAKGMLQEVPYLDTFQTMAKWTFSVPSPERIPEVFRRAFTLGAFGTAGAGDHRNAAGHQHGAGGDAAVSQDPARALRSRSRRCRQIDRIAAGRQAAADLRRARRALVARDRRSG